MALIEVHGSQEIHHVASLGYTVEVEELEQPSRVWLIISVAALIAVLIIVCLAVGQ